MTTTSSRRLRPALGRSGSGSEQKGSGSRHGQRGATRSSEELDPWRGTVPPASTDAPLLHLVVDTHGIPIGLAVSTSSSEAGHEGAGGLDACEGVHPGRDVHAGGGVHAGGDLHRHPGVDDVVPDPNVALRDAMAMLGRALQCPPPSDTAGDAAPGAALRARVGLLEELLGLTTAGLAATLAALRNVGAIKDDGAASTADWVKANTSRSGRDAARAGRLADNLDQLPATADALASGLLTAEAADAVVKAARDGRIGDPEQVERELLPLATSASPEQLRAGIRQRHQAIDAAAMLRDERRQHTARRLHLNRRASGMWGLHGELPDEVGQQLATALEAFDQPEPDGTPVLQRRRPEQRRADALAALVGVTLDRGFAPGTGGIVRPHISVIVPAATFAADLGHQHGHDGSGHDGSGHDGSDHGSGDHGAGDHGSGDDGAHHGGRGSPDGPRTDDPAWARLPAGDLEWGGSLSPQAVRRICCDADVSRIVMTSDSQVLDVGRATRIWSQPQRRAVNARDRHCRGPSCTAPIGWTQIHHIRWWKRDRGPTDLDNGIALCTRCHHLVHDRGWSVELDVITSEATWTSPTGVVTVTRPPGREVHQWRPPRTGPFG